MPFVELTGAETSQPLDSIEMNKAPGKLLAVVLDMLIADLNIGGSTTDTLLQYFAEEDVHLPVPLFINQHNRCG